MAVPLISRAKENQIIEAASALIQHVILAIAPDPPDRGRDVEYHAGWAKRFTAISDLNVITPTTEAEYLDSPLEQSDRWPYLGFVMQEKKRAPAEYGEETFHAILGALIGTWGETFPISQKEMHEIHHDVQTILYLDKSLGGITGKGGVIDVLRFFSFSDPIYDSVFMARPWLVIQFNYEIFYREAVYR